MKRVVVGLSGGVDSSVAALLLKRQGYDVVGIFMKNWHDESVTIANECPWVEDSNDAMLVAQQLDIPFQVIDLSETYRERVVEYMFKEYSEGRTPNPDVLCNREIKFDSFYQEALRLGADYVATGHYCRKGEAEAAQGEYRLLSGLDRAKDQSYFLCQISQQQLGSALFPIGHLQKREVRALAQEAGLPTAAKKDSQGLCFVGKVRLPEFLQQQLAAVEGDIVELPADVPLHAEAGAHPAVRPYSFSPAQGRVVGRHQGAHFFTVGQRKGLHVGGKEKPLFVVGTDVRTNTVYTGQGEDHPALYRNALRVASGEVHWVRPSLAMRSGEERRYLARIRYRQPLVPCTLRQLEDGMHIYFDEAQRGVAAGQFAAWYAGEELLGSGPIAQS